MAVDWDALVLAPVMDVFGEGDPADDMTLPLYSPKGGDPFRLRGAVFDRAYHEVTDLGDGTQGTTLRPILGVRASLFASPPKQDDSVYIPSAAQTYGIADVRPDEHGHIVLVLIEVA